MSIGGIVLILIFCYVNNMLYFRIAMNNITYFTTLRSTTPEDISWETMVTTIRGDYLREKTEMYRRAAAESDKALMTRIKQSCPGIVCQAVLERGRGKENIRAYTGTFMGKHSMPFTSFRMRRLAEWKSSFLTFLMIMVSGHFRPVSKEYNDFFIFY